MAYKLESIKKMVEIMTSKRAELEARKLDDVKMCISRGNRKIGRVMNVSLPPVLSCGNCKECMHYCYDIKACLQYPQTVIDARMRNYVIMCGNRRRYFDEIDAAISRRRTNKMFRWHVAGDIVDLDYFAEMVEMARRHPDFIFWTYTKMYHVVNRYVAENGGCRFIAIPSNFTVMFSEWDGMALDNPYGFPTFSVKMKDGNKNHPAEYFDGIYRCPGNCDVCKMAGRGCPYGESCYADEH